MESLVICSVILILLVLYMLKYYKKTIRGKGNSTTIKRSINDYRAISLSSGFDIELIEGNEDKLILNGEENLLEYIITKVKKEKLFIEVKKGYKLKPSSSQDSISIKAPAKSVNSISIMGSGNIGGKYTLKSQDFTTRITGSGNINLNVDVETLSTKISGSGYLDFSGKAKNFNASAAGNCKINAYGLEAENVDLSLSGSGNMKITAIKDLRVRVSGTGYVRYQGNPKKIDLKTSGLGRAIEA